MPLQVPHSRVPPHPSLMVPQLAFAPAQVLGVHVPHTFGVCEPHVWLGGQSPHWMMPPQPSLMGPQSLPSAAHVVGVHGAPQTFGVPPPPHV